MAINQSNTAKHITSLAIAQTAGALAVTVLSVNFKEGYTAATDIIEIGGVPADHQVISAVLIGVGVGVLTADVGLLNGEFGDADDIRALTADLLFNDADVNDNEATATAGECLAIPVQSKNVGLGIKLSGDVAASAAKTLTLVLTCAA